MRLLLTLSILAAFLNWWNEEEVYTPTINESTITCDRERDSLALVALYNSTNGANWTNTWDLSVPIEEWYGVTLNEDGYVSCLALNERGTCNFDFANYAGNNLTGILPDLDLMYLEFLQLSGNNLTGEIPDFTSLPNLKRLQLGGNTFSSNVPSFVNCPLLEVISLEFCGLKGTIPEFTNLIELSSLGLYSNELTGTIPNFESNAKLIDLRLYQNNLESGIPSQLGELTELRNLYIHQNNLSGEIPKEIGNLIELTNLRLDNNNLNGEISIQLGNLINLTQLNLHNNNLTGEIPVTLGNLTKLELFDLSNNSLSGLIPAELGNLFNLTQLWLYNNSLSGEIPETLGNLLNLDWLRLSSNSLAGKIPSELGNLESLTQLWLNNNSLSGEVPVELGRLINLERLLLSNNELSGCFPEELLILCDINYSFTNNPFLPWQGDFERFCNGEEQIGAPCDYGDPNTENDVITEDCACAGQPIIVNECRARDSLALVALYNSTDGANWTNTWDLSVPMEEWFGVSLNGDGCVSDLHITENNVSGELPSELGNLINLKSLRLDRNNLIGEIPATLSQLISIENLSLGENQLIGNIPKELKSLENIERLWLSDNQLSGEMPPELGILVTLKTLNVGKNNFSGEIPIEYYGLPNLSRFYFSDNQFTGKIPSEIGNLTKLVFFEVYKNSLTGEIPSEIRNLEYLKFFRIYDNNFSGKLPNELVLLDSLREIRVEKNNFSGCFFDEQLSFCGLSPYQTSSSGGYNFTNNPLLPWQGDFERFCNRESQIGAPCDDGDPNTENDVITEDCACAGQPIIVNECRERDSLALVALYNSTNGANWTNTWDLSAPMEEWFGVTLNEDGCVTLLVHNTNELSGEIPVDLGNLSDLTLLALDNNNLTGVIPTELGNLSNLIQLWLNRNELSGNIPTELGNLSNLTGLYLYNNELSGSIPLELGSLSSLTRLYLDNNNLSNCYPGTLLEHCGLGFSDNVNLDGYNFTNNPLLPWQGDFERFCNGEAQIGAPCDDGDPNTENDVITEDCACAGQPIIVNECRERDSLALVALYNSTDGANWTNTWDLSAPMEEWFGVYLNADNCVDSLNLSSNRLSGELPALSALESLRHLNLFNNSLQGSIPNFNLPSLIVLSLGLNNLSGSIPSFTALPNLQQFIAWNNNLTGEVPSFEGFNNFFFLNIYGNNFSGLPTQFNSRITGLFLNDCNLQGKLPNLDNLTNLFNLNLSNNNFTGCFPNSYSRLCENIEVKDFTNNPLLPWRGDFERFCNGEAQIGASCNDGDPNTGNDVITEDCDCAGQPVIINECRERDSLALVVLYNSTDGANWTNTWDLSMPMEEWYGVTLNGDGCVTCLDLDGEVNSREFGSLGNNLIGEIPVEIGNLLDLTSLSLGDNNLIGNIPLALTSLKELKFLSLENNRLDGGIPIELENLKKIEVLSLYGNNIGGNIPIGLSQLSNLEILYLHNNKITGDIPMELGQLLKLTHLYLSSNNLTGNIPVEFGQLSSLKILFLSSNNLSGNIPITIGQLSNLEYCILRDNELSGNIPFELSQLSKLSRLDLSHNNLVGIIPTAIGKLSSLDRYYLYNNNLGSCVNNEIEDFCNLSFQDFNGFYINNGGDTINVISQTGYNFTNNPLLPWQGDFERFCNGEAQIGAPCDDGDEVTNDEKIQEDCLCKSYAFSVAEVRDCQQPAFQVLWQGGVSPYECSWELMGSNGQVNNSTLTENESTIIVGQGGRYAITLIDAEGTPVRDTIDLLDLSSAKVSGDFQECESFTTLNAQLSDGLQTGFWTPLTTGALSDDEAASTVVSDLAFGENAFVWTVSKEDCIDYDADTLVVFREGYPIAADDAYCISFAKPIVIDLMGNDDWSACKDYFIRFPDEKIAARLTEIDKGRYELEVSSPNEILEFEYVLYNAFCPQYNDTASIYLEVVPTLGNVLEKAVGITPNGDGKNETFVIKDLEINSYPKQEIRIFNQWGQVIFSAAPYLNDWNGKHQNGEDVPEGTYYFLLRLGEGFEDRVGRVVVLR